MARVNYNGRLVKIIPKEFLSIENICDYLTDIFSARLTKEERENFKVLSSIPNWESALKDFIGNLDFSERKDNVNHTIEKDYRNQCQDFIQWLRQMG